MMRALKNFLVLAGMIGGPFLSVGALVFYRRALEWWYEHPIAMEHDSAVTASEFVLVGVVLTVGFAVIYRLVEKRWWWESRS